MPFNDEAPQLTQNGYGTPLKPLSEMSVDQLVQLNEYWYKRVLAGRAHVEREALLSLAYFLGQQYVELMSSTNSSTLMVPPVRKGRVRTTSNMIKPIVRQEMARLLKNRPQGTCIPDGDDAEDFEAARAADRIVEHVWREYDVEDLLTEGVQWSLLGGSALLNVHWDPDATTKYGEQGDYIFRCLSIFEWGVPNIRTTRVEDQQYIQVTKTMETSDIYDIWGVVVLPEARDKYGQLEQRLLSAITYNLNQQSRAGFPGSTLGRDYNNILSTCVVKETWIKPGRIAPAGAVLITAGGKLLDVQPWPSWTNGTYPFSKIDYTRVPGSVYGQGMVQDLIPIQRRYNRALSIIIEAMNIRAQMGVALPRGTEIRKVASGMGTVFELPPNAAQNVQSIQLPDIGDLPFREVENCMQAFKDIAAQHDVSQGINPPGARAGSQIELLKEYDDSASVISQRSIERSTERLCNVLIDIAKRKWDTQRIVMTIGTSADVETRTFLTKDSLMGAGQYAVVPGSAWPYSKAERQNLVMQLFQMGLIGGEEALRNMDMGGLQNFVDEHEIDVRQARRENQKFQQIQAGIDPNTGAPIDVMSQVSQIIPQDWENHDVHIAEHEKIKKMPQYESWPMWKRKAFDAHIQGHYVGARVKLINQAHDQQMLGAPPMNSTPPEAMGTTDSGLPHQNAGVPDYKDKNVSGNPQANGKPQEDKGANQPPNPPPGNNTAAPEPGGGAPPGA